MRELEEGACWVADGGDRKGEESLITGDVGGRGGVREIHVRWFSAVNRNYIRLTVCGLSVLSFSHQSIRLRLYASLIGKRSRRICYPTNQRLVIGLHWLPRNANLFQDVTRPTVSQKPAVSHNLSRYRYCTIKRPRFVINDGHQVRSDCIRRSVKHTVIRKLKPER